MPSGITAAWRELRLTSNSMTPKPETNWAAARAPARSQSGPPAAAAMASGAGNSTAPREMLRPTPKRSEILGASTAPRRAPVAPIPNAMPITPAESPRLRLAYSTNSPLPATKVKKLTVAAQPSPARSTGCRTTKARPSLARRSSEGSAVAAAERFGDRDPADQDRRRQERQGVHHYGHGRGQHLDQWAADGRSRDERRGPGGAQLAVGVDVGSARHQAHEERRVGGVEQHPRGAGQQRHDVQLPQGHRVQEVGRREAEQHRGPHQVGEDHQSAFAGPVVDPGTQDHGEQVRRPDERGQPRHLVGRGVQGADRDQGQGQLGDPVAELRDGLTGPEAAEPPVPPQRCLGAPRRAGHGVRPVCSSAPSGRT